MYYLQSQAELDPLGSNVGLSNPYNQQNLLEAPGGSRGGGYGGWGDPFGGYSCRMDGFEMPCSTVMYALSIGIAEPPRFRNGQPSHEQPIYLGRWEADNREGARDRFVPFPGLGWNNDGTCITAAVVGEKQLSSTRNFQLTPDGNVEHDGWHVLGNPGDIVQTLEELQGVVLNARSQGEGLAFADVYTKGVGIAIYKDLGVLSVKKGQSVTTNMEIGKIGIKGEKQGLHFAFFVGSLKDYNKYRSITAQMGALQHTSNQLINRAETAAAIKRIESKLNAIDDKIYNLRRQIKKEWFANNLSETPVGDCPPSVYNKVK